MNNFEISEFRFLSTKDNYNVKYEAWSRIYEYPLVLDILQKLGASKHSSIHNTSWGFEGCHVTFKNDLDNLYNNVLHSDIKGSNLKNTAIYNICEKIQEQYLNYFDFVINISTIEEVNYPNHLVINNLFEQVKPGGYLIITFDYDKNNCNTFGNGSMNLLLVETYINRKIDTCENTLLNGSNSFLQSYRYSNLNCGLLVIKKNKL